MRWPPTVVRGKRLAFWSTSTGYISTLHVGVMSGTGTDLAQALEDLAGEMEKVAAELRVAAQNARSGGSS